jgi:hypothetical protein
VILRTLVSIVNFVVILVAVVLYLEWPALGTWVVYVLFGWILLTFILMYSSLGNRRVTSAASQPAGAGPAFGSVNPFEGPPAPPAPAPVHGGPAPAPIDFCLFCGTTLPAGAARCPACGHPVVVV